MNKVSKNLRNIKTPILTYGEPFAKNNDVIICITGNPGVVDFYRDFATQVHKNTSMPLCVIGHAGHEGGNKTLWSLESQLKHKFEFMENHVNKNSRIHFIGHSIGAWIIVELLYKEKHLIERVSSINLLFPTIQRMAESKNGKFVNIFLRKINRLILFLSKILYFLPERVLSYLVGIYLSFQSLPIKFSNAIIKILNPDALKNVLFMAFDEMDTVKSLNIEGFHLIKHLTNIIYTKRDGWAPLEYMEALNQFKPQLQLMECCNIEHAFVLKSSEQVASLVSDFIKNKVAR